MGHGSRSGTERKRIRDERLVAFICEHYCQSCDNGLCDAHDVMERYQESVLTPSQMVGVRGYELDGASCRNHVPGEGFVMFAHRVQVHYADGRVERRDGWHSTRAVSDIWDDDVEYVSILFSDV